MQYQQLMITIHIRYSNICAYDICAMNSDQQIKSVAIRTGIYYPEIVGMNKLQRLHSGKPGKTGGKLPFCDLGSLLI